MANLPDNRFIASTSLCEYFVNKSSGLPLSGGYAYFYRDIARNVDKLVYQLTGDPNSSGGYSFAPLSNPVRISASGTFQDNSGNPIAIYYFPYDGLPDTSLNQLDLYYVVVKDASGAEQFNRQAWPQIGEDLNVIQSNNSYTNQISNPQFVEVFSNLTSYEENYPYDAGTTTFQIAPGWSLVITANGAGIATVARNFIPGSNPALTNPSYSLTVTPGTSITNLSLVQRLNNNPGIWSQIAGYDSGYISGGILLYSGSSVTMEYAPSVGRAVTVLRETNNTASPLYYNSTVKLPVSANSSTSETGYVDIKLILSKTSPTTFSSVQVVGLNSNQTNVPYLQESVDRQKDHLFHYYNSMLQFKPIKSYLVGWDFPLNPAQFGAVGTVAGSANKSSYIWDQTILYVENSSGALFSRNTSTGALSLRAIGGSNKLALVQYLNGNQIKSLLNNDLSVNVVASTDDTSVACTVSLWWTNSALPNAGSIGSNPNRSIVQTLDSSGEVTATYGTNWQRIERPQIGVGISAAFYLTSPISTFNNVQLSGWNAGATAANTATNFAIVVGFGGLSQNKNIDIMSISLVPGKIATIPAPQTQQEVLRDCQQYFWSTYYGADQTVGAVTTAGAQIFTGSNAFYNNTGSDLNVQSASSFKLDFPAKMVTNPSIVLYSPQSGASNNIASYKRSNIVTATSAGGSTFVSNIATSLWSSSAGLGYVSKSSALFDMIGQFTVLNSYISNTGGPTTPNIDQLFFSYHAVVDARLGVVS